MSNCYVFFVNTSGYYPTTKLEGGECMFFLYLQTIHVTFKGKTKIRNLILCITVILFSVLFRENYREF